MAMGKTADTSASAAARRCPLLNEVLRLPLAVAASPEWVNLYGSPLTAEAPDLMDRHFSPDEYGCTPRVKATLGS